MTGRVLLTGLAVLGSVLCGPSSAFDPEAQIHESDLIVTGRVVAVRPASDATGHDQWTETEVEVGDVWKGTATPRIQVRTPGGALDNPGLALEGSARFIPGEQVLLFLTREDETLRPWRTVFGKYSVRGDGRDARLVGSLPPVLEEIDGPYAASIALDEARHEVGGIVASRSSNDNVDVAQATPLR